MNQLSHFREFVSPALRTVVASNVDVLYSCAFLGLSEGPVMLHVPEMRARYYNVHLLDRWTRTFGSPGTRTTGSGARAFVLTRPGWKDEVPVKAHRMDAPTDFVWIINRIQATGPGDFPEVHAARDSASRATSHTAPSGHSIAPDSTGLAGRLRERTFIDAEGLLPCFDRFLHPRWNRNGADVFGLAEKVSYHPVLLAKLNGFDVQSKQFAAT